MSSLPLVALVGQTNAGKSSILNRMARKNVAIVAREEGTTRDNVMQRIDDRFVLVDTAGLKEPSDDFEASIQEQIEDAIESAQVILVTLDSAKYFDDRDRRIAKGALRSKKPVFLVLNKADLKESLPIEEFRALGVAPERIFYTSATTGKGIRELKKAILGELYENSALSSFSEPVGLPGANPAAQGRAPDPAQPATVLKNSDSPNSADVLKNIDSPNSADVLKNSDSPNSVKFALIGRPNVGKSSLFNAMGKKQQAIVSSRQGTTRDVNRVEVKYKGQELEILDTAGLRRQGRREVGIEKFSAIRTLAAIEEADVCALLVDATEPHAKLDQTLAGQIVEAGKGIIVVVTKADLLSAETVANYYGIENPGERSAADMILDQLERDFDFLPFAPVVVTSAETGQNVTKLFELAMQIAAARKTEIKTADLNKILGEAVAAHPPAGLKNTRPKPKYMVQTDVCPPWFVVHGHDLGLLHWSWKRFLERKLREKYPLVGVPVKFSFRND